MGNKQRRQLGSGSSSFWRIEGFDSTERIFQQDLLAHHLGTRQVRPLLQALAAKAGLELDEIVGAYESRRAPTREPQLRIAGDFQKVVVSGDESLLHCGVDAAPKNLLNQWSA